MRAVFDTLKVSSIVPIEQKDVQHKKQTQLSITNKAKRGNVKK